MDFKIFTYNFDMAFTNRKKKHSKDNKHDHLLKYFAGFAILFFFGVVALIVISIERKFYALPNKIDMVLYDQSNNTIRAQVAAVKKNITFIEHIYILTPNYSTYHSIYQSDGHITVIEYTDTDINNAFLYPSNINQLNDNFIFLSDNIFPLKDITKDLMFYQDRPRVFNIFKSYSKEQFFTNFLVPVMPTMVMSKDILTDVNEVKESTDFVDFVFRQVTEYQLVLRHDLNWDVMIHGDDLTNATTQLNKVTLDKPYFATFHYSGSTDSFKNQAVSKIKTYVDSVFL